MNARHGVLDQPGLLALFACLLSALSLFRVQCECVR